MICKDTNLAIEYHFITDFLEQASFPLGWVSSSNYSILAIVGTFQLVKNAAKIEYF